MSKLEDFCIVWFNKTQAKGQIEADLREAFRLSADQQDTLISLDWMENPWPERWMLNGKEIRFQWD